MKILDAKAGAADNLHLFKRRTTSPDVHATVAALRSTPQALQKFAPPPAINELPFKLTDFDEASGAFTADLDESHDGFDFDRSKQHFKNHGVVHVGVAGKKDEKVGRITGTNIDSKARRGASRCAASCTTRIHAGRLHRAS